eukprot:4908809-Lingulodinium_polyedra.AAC.1
MDDDIKIEVGLCNMISGPQAMEPAVARILEVLPNKTKAVQPSIALQHLNKVVNESGWKLVPSAAQALAKWTEGLLCQLSEEADYVPTKSKKHASAGASLSCNA